jgi:hypothetical protein
LRGRKFFEEIIRDNLDLGRTDRVQSFDRGDEEERPESSERTLIQDRAHPSLHINFTNFDVK